EPLRRLLARGTRIERAAVVDGAAGAAGAFGAAVYPMALVAARAEPAAHDQVAAALGPKSAAPRVPQRLLQAAGPWVLRPAATRGLPDRRTVAAVPYRARVCAAPRRLGGPGATDRGGGAAARRRAPQHGVRHRDARGRGRSCAGGAAQLPLAHGAGASRGGSR